MEVVKSRSGVELIIFEKISLLVGEGRGAGLYRSRVEDLTDDGVVISEPEYISGGALLREGIEIAVRITRRDAAYQFYSRVSARRRNGRKQVVLTPPAGLERVQRRMFARVEITTPITYGILADDVDWSQDNWEGRITWRRSASVNISAGGVLMRIAEPMPNGRLIAMRIDLFREGEVPRHLVAVCRRTFQSYRQWFGGFEYVLAGNLPQHLTAAALSNLPDELREFTAQAQDRLANLLFQKQVEQRQRGVL